MAGNLSFAIAINFLTENFKKGTNQVKAGFRAMQMQVLTFAAALGAGGLGLTNFVSRLIDVARETNRVTTALKNVSGSMGQYANNQRYLLDIAKKYGLEINALTGNFAKFTAAASISGMSMMEQRKIFESVSRACTAFGMSADDSNGVFLALSQMMSKGKISSEELRLQMGERLPVAIQAMAKAAGVSVGQLDKLLKQGKLLSADVLPKFGKALDELIPNVDTDNLETSVNRLKNAFTEFTNGTGVQNRFKALVDGVTKLVQYGANNIKSVITYTIAAIIVLITSKLVNKIIGAIAKAGLAAKAEARSAAKAAGLAFDETAWKAQKASASMRMAFSKAAASVKAAMISMIPTAIIALIGVATAKLISMGREAKRIKNLFHDYRAELNQSSNTSEIVNLKTQYKIATDIKANLNDRKNALSQINKELGTGYSIDEKSLTIQGDLNKKFAERVELLKAAAEVDYLTRKKLETEDKIKSLGSGMVSNLSESIPTGGKFNPWNGPVGIKTVWNLISPWGGISNAKSQGDELAEQQKILSDINTRLENVTVKANGLIKNGPVGLGSGDDNKKKTPLQKEQESYDKQLSELKAELEIGKITQAEYNKALGELNIKMFAQARGTNDKEVLESEYYRNIKVAAEKAVQNQDKNAALVEFEKVQKDYNKKVEEYRVQQDKGLITQKELNKNIAALSVDAAKSAAGIKGIGDEADVFIAAMQLNEKLLAAPIKVKPRDTTFDYKKTKADIASENLDKAKEYADKLKEQARETGQTLSDELANAMANVPTLEEALKLAQVREDVKSFSKELNESVYSGVKDIASSADRVVSSFDNLKEVMNDVDASGWEKIMAIWNAMTNVVDSFLSIIKLVENLTEITDKLFGAKQKEIQLDNQAASQKMANAATGIAADTAAAATKKATATQEVNANTASAASEAGKSAAKLPFPWNIVAIGGAIAAAIAAFAVIPKFATGGIYMGGTASGDKGLARLNKGEMVLNMSQQSRLFKSINSGELGGGGRIISSVATAKLRGKDMILIINNELKSQGKKPIS